MTKNIERYMMKRMIRYDTRKNIYTTRQNVGVLAMRKGGKLELDNVPWLSMVHTKSEDIVPSRSLEV